MKHIASFIFLIASVGVLASPGPTAVGEVAIGMRKAEYLAATKSSPVDCKTLKNRDGTPRRAPLKNLIVEQKTLCFTLGLAKEVIVDSIEIEGISYDIVEMSADSTEFIRSVGHSSKALFLNDRLIRLEISFPKVTLETLTAKYGSPVISDSRKVEVCRNRSGGEFKNSVGTLDASWSNGEVAAIFRVLSTAPSSTCTDGLTLNYYILEERKQVELIDNAIATHRNRISTQTTKDSKF